MKKLIFGLILIFLVKSGNSQSLSGVEINPLRGVFGSNWGTVNPSHYELNNFALSIYSNGQNSPFAKSYPGLYFHMPSGAFSMGLITTPGALGGYGVGNFVLKGERWNGSGPMNIFFDMNSTNQYNTVFWRFGGIQTNYKTLVVSNSDRVGIGTDNFPNSYPSVTGDNYRLFVKGGIKAEEIKVELSTTGGWADYVFEKSYKLMSLKNLKKFVFTNKRLPNIPSSISINQNGGIEVSKMMTLQQEKIEENALYIISLNDELEKVKKENEILKKRLAEIEKLLSISK
jgi:hypothetical protein